MPAQCGIFGKLGYLIMLAPVLAAGACAMPIQEGSTNEMRAQQFQHIFAKNVALIPQRLSYEAPGKRACGESPTNEGCYRLGVVLDETCVIGPRIPQNRNRFVVLTTKAGEWQVSSVEAQGTLKEVFLSRLESGKSDATTLTFEDPREHYLKPVIIGTFIPEEQVAMARGGVITGFQVRNDGAEFFSIQIESKEGDIGGPIFSTNGALLGMVVAHSSGGNSPPAGHRFALSISTILGTESRGSDNEVSLCDSKLLQPE